MFIGAGVLANDGYGVHVDSRPLQFLDRFLRSSVRFIRGNYGVCFQTVDSPLVSQLTVRVQHQVSFRDESPWRCELPFGDSRPTIGMSRPGVVQDLPLQLQSSH